MKTTFGVVDLERKQVLTVEALSLREAMEAFKAAGYIGEGHIYHVKQLGDNTPAGVHFNRATQIIKESRK